MLNLETAVGSQKSAQALGAPGTIKKCNITTKVTTTFFLSPCTPISYASFLRPTAVSRLKSHVKIGVQVFFIAGALMGWNGATLLAAMTAGVFGGFTNHISEQIMKDKVDFAVAEKCTVWHYEQLKKKRIRPDVEKTSFQQVDQEGEQSPCPRDYPDGINGARAAFAQSQSSLSLSLTFYQFAFVGDRNDDGEYDAVELRDVSESLGVSYLEQEEMFQHLAKLNGKFDAVRETVEFSVLTDGMQVLFTKGYRLTPSDQVALNKVTGEQQS